MEYTEDKDRIFQFLADYSKERSKTKVYSIFIGGGLVIGFAISTLLILGYTKSMSEGMKLIDKQGYVYTSKVIDPNKAKQFQAYSFILNFCRLNYSFDKISIKNGLNRALLLGDKTVAMYYNKHMRDNLYPTVITQGQVVTINEQELIQNLNFQGGRFATQFTQVFHTGTSEMPQIVHIEGDMQFISPSMDNPNGFYITNFLENYLQ